MGIRGWLLGTHIQSSFMFHDSTFTVTLSKEMSYSLPKTFLDLSLEAFFEKSNYRGLKSQKI